MPTLVRAHFERELSELKESVLILGSDRAVGVFAGNLARRERVQFIGIYCLG